MLVCHCKFNYKLLTFVALLTQCHYKKLSNKEVIWYKLAIIFCSEHAWGFSKNDKKRNFIIYEGESNMS